ncbi:MAG: ubiquinol-cytochrome C chaperone family protein [Asticcacaulis sp.]
MLSRLFKPLKTRPAKLSGDKLYAACVAQSRRPVFYLDYGVEDAIGARFELLTFHVGMVVMCLKALPTKDNRHEQAAEVAQKLFDAYLLALDSTLREQGVGDLAVPKRMKVLGKVIYTRMKRWDDLWVQDAGLTEQADYAARTLFAGSDYENNEADGEVQNDALTARVLEKAQAFAIYALSARQSLRVDALLSGHIDWPQPEALTLENEEDSTPESDIEKSADGQPTKGDAT